MFLRAPVKKLSTQRTCAPSEIKRAQRWEPRKPAPPVTRIRFSRCIQDTLLFDAIINVKACSRAPDPGLRSRLTGWPQLKQKSIIDQLRSKVPQRSQDDIIFMVNRI